MTTKSMREQLETCGADAGTGNLTHGQVLAVEKVFQASLQRIRDSLPEKRRCIDCLAEFSQTDKHARVGDSFGCPKTFNLTGEVSDYAFNKALDQVLQIIDKEMKK